MFNYLILNLY